MGTTANPFPTTSAAEAPQRLDEPRADPRTEARTDVRPAGAAPARGQTMQRVVQGAHDAIERAADSAAPHLQRFEDTLATANSGLHQRADQAREMGAEWTESLRTTVREHPLAALAVAVAVGMLISRTTR
ncbi:MAG: hypothetical protein IPM15_03830 [Betaproteobacteria bacterium]|nr:hypothetical protein [Betaproteobacteria bacterium]MCC6250816.1 hypothetical protein [Rubrivivax sp.]MCL4697047.1 hypothetical protein [Burkholderiaceae bacterium]